MFISKFFALLSLASVAFTASWIVPGAVWYDTSGAKIDAHGGAVWKVGGTFYWIGASVSNGIVASSGIGTNYIDVM